MARKKRQISKSRVPVTSKKASGGAEFDPDYTDVKADLKRIGILAGTFVVILVIISIVMPYLPIG
jgi:hypothetical protein